MGVEIRVDWIDYCGLYFRCTIEIDKLRTILREESKSSSYCQTLDIFIVFIS